MTRVLPARADLEHLKHEARALQRAFLQDDPSAVARVQAVLGNRSALKLTAAQRVLAREYGFATWTRLRSHVLAQRGIGEAVDAFLASVQNGDTGRMFEVVKAEPRIVSESLHVAAVLGAIDEVRRLLAADPSLHRTRAGAPPAEPLVWVCYSPLHGESAHRDAALAACVRALLDAGADPDARDGRYGIPALYAVTGARSVSGIARMLLEAGAPPDDGESLFHAAEHFHEDALELLLEYGVNVNFVGEWGNTALHFLLQWHDVEREEPVRRGFVWLLEHGADPEIRSGRDQETALHAAVRTGQSPRIVRMLLDRGADVQARRADGRTPWVLAERGGFDELKALLEERGAQPEVLSPGDALLAVLSRGDGAGSSRRATPELVASLEPADLRLLVEAARNGRIDVVRACLAAGFPVDTRDEQEATALHHACIAGHADVVTELLRHGADFRLRDREHHATPLDWATFGADYVRESGGDYPACVRVLLEAGARRAEGAHPPRDAAVREVLASFS